MTDDDALRAPRRKRDERLRRKRQERDQKVISIFARTGALPVDGLDSDVSRNGQSRSRVGSPSHLCDMARLDDPRIGAGIDRLGPTRMYRPYDHLGEAHLRTHSRRGRVS
jgi:hypothetical protein